MKQAAFALVLFAAASSAVAGDADSASGLRCGVMLGGKSLVYAAGEEAKQRKYQRLDARLATAQDEPLRLGPAAAAADREPEPLQAASNASDARLPAKLTLATLGCSW